MNITSSITTYHSFGDWNLIDNELRCYTRWSTFAYNQCLYLLAQQGDLILMNHDDIRYAVVYNGPTANISKFTNIKSMQEFRPNPL